MPMDLFNLQFLNRFGLKLDYVNRGTILFSKNPVLAYLVWIFHGGISIKTKYLLPDLDCAHTLLL